MESDGKHISPCDLLPPCSSIHSAHESAMSFGMQPWRMAMAWRLAASLMEKAFRKIRKLIAQAPNECCHQTSTLTLLISCFVSTKAYCTIRARKWERACENQRARRGSASCVACIFCAGVNIRSDYTFKQDSMIKHGIFDILLGDLWRKQNLRFLICCRKVKLSEETTKSLKKMNWFILAGWLLELFYLGRVK